MILILDGVRSWVMMGNAMEHQGRPHKEKKLCKSHGFAWLEELWGSHPAGKTLDLEAQNTDGVACPLPQFFQSYYIARTF